MTYSHDPSNTYNQPNPYDPYEQYGTGGLVEHPQTTVVLILGILSLFTLITGPFAWFMGGKARREMKQSPGRWTESQGVTIGWILGIVSTVILIIMLVIAIIGLVAVAYSLWLMSV